MAEVSVTIKTTIVKRK